MKKLQDAIENFKYYEQELQTIKLFYEKNDISNELEKLKKILNIESENYWEKPEYIATSKKINLLDEIKNQLEEIQETFSSISDLISIFNNENDSSKEVQDLIAEIEKFGKKISGFKRELLLNQEFDANNCFLSINPGAGGTESQDWAEMLLRMYLRFCEKNRFNVETLDLQKGNEAGIKTVSLFVKGKNAYGLLKNEAGIHRLVRISPFDSNKRRHTSFAAVFISPEVNDKYIEIKPQDLRIDTFRSSGAGGQHVNTTDSAVRITHLPTNTVVQCQNERSQHQNKERAMQMLFSKLVEQEEQKKRDAANAKEKQKIEWGSQIRSYILHPYKLIKDHRTGEESSQPDLILGGELEQFIEAMLIGKKNDKKDPQTES